MFPAFGNPFCPAKRTWLKIETKFFAKICADFPCAKNFHKHKKIIKYHIIIDFNS